MTCGGYCPPQAQSLKASDGGSGEILTECYLVDDESLDIVTKKARYKQKLFDIFPGAIPDDAIYKTLQIEIDPGEVKFSAPAQRHAYQGHPEDVPLIIPYLAQVISDPMYMGDDFKNPGKIEFVCMIPGTGKSALIAVSVELDGEDGYYHVCSSYLITQSEVDKKRHKGILKHVKK